MTFSRANDRAGPGTADFEAEERQAFLRFLAIFVLVWTVYAALSRANLDTHSDMAENFAWSRELALGYHKHPPFFAWVVAAWFKVFPSQDWAYYLLSFTNVALALAGAWALIGLFDRSPRRTAAVMALAVTPFFTFSAIKFNANTILLPLWPWLAYAGVRAVRDLDVRFAALVGALAAVSLLSKYVSVVMLAAAVLTLFTMPRWREFLTSRTLPVTVAAFLLVLAPHLVWLHAMGYPTLRYVDTNKAHNLWHLVSGVFGFSGAQVLWLVPAFILLLFTGRDLGARDLAERLRLGVGRVDPTILVLSLAPFAMMVLAALLSFTRLSAPWGIPLWFAASFAVACLIFRDGSEVDAAKARRFAIGFALVALAVSPIVRAVEFYMANKVVHEPRREASLLLAERWRAKTGLPLRIVAGSQSYSSSVTFYAPDRPSEFIDFDPMHAPWITPQRLRREGLGIICAAEDQECLTAARPYETAGSERFETVLQQSLLGWKGPPARLVMILVPPAAQP